jgi:RNA polymerase sigma-70 factor (ECF subfamily)
MDNNQPAPNKYLDDEHSWVTRAQKGEVSAYQVLYDRYKHRIYYYIRARVRNKDDAQDLTARTFSCAFTKLKRLKKPQSFRQWLFKIAQNEVRMYYRQQSKRIKTVSLGEVSEGKLLTNPTAHSLLDTVRQTLKQLPEADQNLIIYRLYDKLSYKEIAEIIGCSENMVGYRLKKALKKFADLYKRKYKISKKEGDKK